MPTFLEIAQAAVARGLEVLPLQVKSKAAIEKDWQTHGYVDLDLLSKWNDKNSAYNCGALCSKSTTWILDIDHVGWFMESFPPNLRDALKTFTVKTGSGGLQFHFKQNDDSQSRLGNKSVKNPNKDKYVAANGEPKPTVCDILWDKHQGLLPGSTHPNGNLYAVHKDLPIVEASSELINWILSQLTKQKVEQEQKKISAFKLQPQFAANVEKMLSEAGLKYDKEERDGQTFFNYHHRMGRCFVRGASHAASGEEPNPRQSAFVFDPKSGQLWHNCFSSQCEFGIVNTKKALAELGLDWRNLYSVDGQVTIALESLGDVRAEHIRYFWDKYLPINKLVHFAGQSTEGKSPVSLDIAARVSKGLPWPDETPNTFGPRSVILLSAEDGMSDIIVPRLDLMGANRYKIHTIRATVVRGTMDQERALDLAADIEAIKAEAERLPDLSLVIIDPITNYLGKLNMNKEEDVRSVLMPLSIWAGEKNCCVLTIGHLNKKDKGTSPKQRIMGAAAFVGVARFLYLFGPDPEDSDKFSHVMVQDRGVGAPSLRYKTVAVKQEWDGLESDVVKVEWLGVSDATGEDVVDPASGKDKSKYDDAALCLKEFLRTGKKTADECEETLADAGFMVQSKSNPTGMNPTRLRAKIGAKSERKEKKSWWFLGDGAVTEEMF